MKKKVLVGMSGGVDSSFVVLKMLEAGYHVEGATMHLFHGNGANFAISEAQRIAKYIGIKHHVVDITENFKKKVIDKFIIDYQTEKTPIPCVDCNKNIKFGHFFDFAMQNGFDYVATGHYAKIIKNDNIYQIHRPADSSKDQTHFLFNIKQNQLSHILFPLGDMIKKDIKEKIKEYTDLEFLSTKKESADICFLEGKRYSEFDPIKQIDKNITQNGDILHIKTKQKLGQHTGVIKYTIGQRNGIGVAHTEPLYVIERDIINNILYVGEREFLFNMNLSVENVNFLDDSLFLQEQIVAQVSPRALQKPVSAVIEYDKTTNTATVKSKEPIRAITKGQACGFYDGNRLLGGGIIS